MTDPPNCPGHITLHWIDKEAGAYVLVCQSRGGRQPTGSMEPLDPRPYTDEDVLNRPDVRYAHVSAELIRDAARTSLEPLSARLGTHADYQSMQLLWPTGHQCGSTVDRLTLTLGGHNE